MDTGLTDHIWSVVEVLTLTHQNVSTINGETTLNYQAYKKAYANAYAL